MCSHVSRTSLLPCLPACAAATGSMYNLEVLVLAPPAHRSMSRQANDHGEACWAACCHAIASACTDVPLQQQAAIWRHCWGEAFTSGLVVCAASQLHVLMIAPYACGQLWGVLPAGIVLLLRRTCALLLQEPCCCVGLAARALFYPAAAKAPMPCHLAVRTITVVSLLPMRRCCH